MNSAERYRPAGHLSEIEEQVLVALRLLPSGYVVRAPERLVYSMPGSDEVATFRADCEVAGPEGGVLLVEAMSSTALSLLNLCLLAEVDKQVNQSGRALLVLVRGDRAGWIEQSSLPQFATLRIRRFTSEREVVAAVQHTLALVAGAAPSRLDWRGS